MQPADRAAVAVRLKNKCSEPALVQPYSCLSTAYLRSIDASICVGSGSSRVPVILPGVTSTCRAPGSSALMKQGYSTRYQLGRVET